MSLLGIDAGTTGCKAAVFSETGQQLAIAYEEYNIAHPHPGWDELDAVEVWGKIKRTIGRRSRGSRHCGPDPSARGVVDGRGVRAHQQRPAHPGPSILLSDSRGAEYLPRLRQ